MTASDRLVIGFACLGHFVTHALLGLFLTLVLVIERDWSIGYASLIALWTLGAFLIGAGAPVAGWLADRVGEARMMVVFYIGAGASCVAAATVSGPLQLQIALGALGLFSSIYHPVGMAWVVKHAQSRGLTMGILGIFGSIGVAASGLLAGFISDLSGWRMAFAAPGLVSVAIGIALAVCLAAGVIRDRDEDAVSQPEAGRSDQVWAFAVLAVTMFCGSVFYNAFVTALPKWVEVEVGSNLPGTLAGIGGIVALIYLIGSISQLIGGHLSDRLPMKWLYVASFAIKLPIVAAAAVFTGWAMLPVAILIVFLIDLGAPVENLLLAHYSPKRRRGLSYGIKHAMGLVAAPIGVQLVAEGYAGSGGFTSLFLVLAALLGLMLLAALLLPVPSDGKTNAAVLPQGSRSA